MGRFFTIVLAALVGAVTALLVRPTPASTPIVTSAPRKSRTVEEMIPLMKAEPEYFETKGELTAYVYKLIRQAVQPEMTESEAEHVGQFIIGEVGRISSWELDLETQATLNEPIGNKS